jgi:hypothetical protein
MNVLYPMFAMFAHHQRGASGRHAFSGVSSIVSRYRAYAEKATLCASPHAI